MSVSDEFLEFVTEQVRDFGPVASRKMFWGAGLLPRIVCFCLIFSGCSYRRKLVNVRENNPGIVFDIRYATEDNFTGERLYDEPFCYLVRSTAEKLKGVQKELESKGLKLKIFDAYRPFSVQKKMWQAVPDKRYVEDPALGSAHNRGTAVDVTLVDSDGRELAMGTAFDDFSESSSPHYFGFPYEILSNRFLLKGIMKKHGFRQSHSEWWHFYDKDGDKFPVLDIEF